MARTLQQAMAYLGLAEQRDSAAEKQDQAYAHDYPHERFEEYEQDQEAQFDYSETDYKQDAASSDTMHDQDHTVTISRSSVLESITGYEGGGSTGHAATRDYESGSYNQNPYSHANESEDDLRRITTIHPRSYNDAKIIGESFRENIPVIMNVTDMGESEAKRLVDFSAGLAFALHGSIERVTDKVFLLTPANLEVLGAEASEAPVALDSDPADLFNQG
ncbi:MAG: cell division protein SepF [Rothia sp. (in: high G+C Gram-positive bacteria)]|nr:cell division protein SepF [Rothia sp. (in: high G+C Gram-positive bacteria)]